MKSPTLVFSVLSIAVASLVQNARATNPLIMDQFTADPTARVFEGKIYVYPSHDIKAPPEYTGRPNWFVMEDYHVFSSENLTDWTDHGVIVRQTEVPWVNPNYAMWAPDCVFKNGKYFFYFPAQAKPVPDQPRAGGFRVGVAIADKPTGPFKPLDAPIEGVRGIDPCVLIDKDGSAYLYFSQGRIFVAKLKDNMTELDGPVKTIDNLPTKGLLEGPFVFERKGIYYLTYPHVENKTERLEYSTSDNPLGPFKPAGVILDESTSGCWTVHHSILEYQGQWYLFYHDKDLSPAFDKNRAIRADRLFFNEDGTMQKVIPTLRGVGRVAAKSEIEIDRYSATSGDGVVAAFLDAANPHAGWKIALPEPGSWVRFNEVDFAHGEATSVNVRALAPAGGAIEIRADREDGPVLARVAIKPGAEWQVIRAAAGKIPSGVHDLVVKSAAADAVELDWISFP